MFNTKEEFLEEVNRGLSGDPSLIGDVMHICTTNWKNYEDAVDKRRNWQATRALSELSHLYVGRKKKIPQDRVPWLIEAIDFMFPDGFESTDGFCDADKKFLRLFVEACKEGKYDPDGSFIKDTRGFSEQLKKLYAQSEETE